MQATNSIAPTRKGFVNSLAETSYNTIKNYDVKLPAHASKPTSYKKAGNSPFPKWFRAEEKEKQGVSRVYRMGTTYLIPHHARNPEAR